MAKHKRNGVQVVQEIKGEILFAHKTPPPKKDPGWFG